MAVVWRKIYGRDGLTREQGIIRGEEEREVTYFGDEAEKVARPNRKDGGTRFTHSTTSGLDIDDKELSYHGDSIKTVGIERDHDAGEIHQTFARFDSNGKYQGEYTATWEQTADGQLTHKSTKRYL